MKAVDALEMHADLKMKISDKRYFTAMTYQLILDLTRSEEKRSGPLLDQYVATGEQYVKAAKYGLDEAETFFVAADMCDLVAHAAEVLDSSDIADMKLAPSKQGFVYFEKPIGITDVRGETLLVSAILWHPIMSPYGYVSHMWNDEYRHPDYVAQSRNNFESEEVSRFVGRWGYIGVSYYKDGEPIGDKEELASEELMEWYEKEGLSAKPVTNTTRILHALWLMMMQKLAAVERVRGDKRLLRRMSWMNLPGEVTVIQLRHVEYQPREGESQVNWKHRWIVRGFWRWQPFKNDAGEWDRKRIWIDPYMKGPADAPLKISQKVNALVR